MDSISKIALVTSLSAIGGYFVYSSLAKQTVKLPVDCL